MVYAMLASSRLQLGIRSETLRSLVLMAIFFRTASFTSQTLKEHFREQLTMRYTTLSDQDEGFLRQAVKCAENGIGHTFPNPAVGCVLVRQDTGEVVGAGFHPRAGFPHAEVFALLQAAGHVPDGVEAALSVVHQTGDFKKIQELAETYVLPGGPAELFGDALGSHPITAYVTLEPCCHYGRTPPCAGSLALAKASRVVVGFRDPNPRVDGGGVQVLEDAGISVDMALGDCEKACADLVSDFVKRISPRDQKDYDHVTGAMRSALRSLSNRKKNENTLSQVVWQGESVNVEDGFEEAIDGLPLSAEWMEGLDSKLWKEELVSLKLNKAVAKKKGTKQLGERIANILEAHVAQTVGHTVLLYRPGMPPVLSLEKLVAEKHEQTKE